MIYKSLKRRILVDTQDHQFVQCVSPSIQPFQGGGIRNENWSFQSSKGFIFQDSPNEKIFTAMHENVVAST
jgi:hypothetical protein